MASRDTRGEGALVRRMHAARLRQWIVAGTSVLLAACGVVFLSPAEVGEFAYYSIAALALLNAVFAVRQSALVIFPVEKLLRKIRRVERAVDGGKFGSVHFTVQANDAFACLAAGFDNLIAKISEKARVASERAIFDAAIVQSTPFTIFTVSRSGVVGQVFKDMYGLVSLLGIEAGKGPSAETYGNDNVGKVLKTVEECFAAGSDDLRWLDFDVGPHRIRGCIRRINELTAVVELGDLPAIDKIVADSAGETSEGDHTHRRDALKRFAASIAHDGKNIFAAIGNLIEMNKTSSDPSVTSLIPIAEDAVRRGTNLMKELTTFAGMARFNLVCTPAAEGIGHIVANPTLRALLPANVQLITNVSDKPMPQIDLDADQFWKVVFNLVKNAVEAMNGCDGHVWITAEPFTMSAHAAKSFYGAGSPANSSGVLVTITDDGPGIPDKMKSHLFEPYYSSKGAGRGIGLSTVMAVVDAHGGALKVKSAQGTGTAFLVFLPASRNTDEEIQMMQEVAPNGEILLVDDDPAILRTTGMVLRALKIAAHPAGNATDAIVKLRSFRSRIKAAIVDGHVNGAVSADLVRRIHVESPNIPVIVASGSPKEAIDAAFADVAYDRFLEKPYSAADLSAALAQLAPAP